MTIRDIAAASGLSYRKLAERFGIPYRTMEDWSAGKSKPPEYVLRMMTEILKTESGISQILCKRQSVVQNRAKYLQAGAASAAAALLTQ